MFATAGMGVGVDIVGLWKRFARYLDEVLGHVPEQNDLGAGGQLLGLEQSHELLERDGHAFRPNIGESESWAITCIGSPGIGTQRHGFGGGPRFGMDTMDDHSGRLAHKSKGLRAVACPPTATPQLPSPFTCQRHPWDKRIVQSIRKLLAIDVSQKPDRQYLQMGSMYVTHSVGLRSWGAGRGGSLLGQHHLTEILARSGRYQGRHSGDVI